MQVIPDSAEKETEPFFLVTLVSPWFKKVFEK